MMKWETPPGLVQISTSRKKITPQTIKHGQEYKKGEESECWVPIQPKGYARSSKWDPLCNNYSLLIHTAISHPSKDFKEVFKLYISTLFKVLPPVMGRTPRLMDARPTCHLELLTETSTIFPRTTNITLLG
nr:hypothetical protein CFP56_18496 [Quercus suber]